MLNQTKQQQKQASQDKRNNLKMKHSKYDLPALTPYRDFYVTVKQANVIIANRVKCFSSEDPRKIASELMFDVAQQWNLENLIDSFSWAVFCNLECQTPESHSKNWYNKPF